MNVIHVCRLAKIIHMINTITITQEYEDEQITFSLKQFSFAIVKTIQTHPAPKK